jgi:hypothetical protein
LRREEGLFVVWISTDESGGRRRVCEVSEFEPSGPDCNEWDWRCAKGEGGGGLWAQIEFAAVACSGDRQGDSQKKLQVNAGVRKLTAEILTNDERVFVDDEEQQITFRTKLNDFQRAALVALVNFELSTAYTVDHVTKMRAKSTSKRQTPPSNQAAQPLEQPPAQT